MRALPVKALVAATALSLAIAPVSADPLRPGHHQRPFQGHPHRHGHHGGNANAALMLGIAGAALAIGLAAQSRRSDCYRREAFYDGWGNYVGSREVEEC